MKKTVYFGPILILAVGYFWSDHINEGTFVPNILFSIFMFVILAIPSFLLAGGHKLFSKKEVTLDENNESIVGKKKSYWFLFSLWVTILGIGLYGLLFSAYY
jgi:hypothetical protein